MYWLLIKVQAVILFITIVLLLLLFGEHDDPYAIILKHERERQEALEDLMTDIDSRNEPLRITQGVTLYMEINFASQNIFGTMFPNLFLNWYFQILITNPQTNSFQNQSMINWLASREHLDICTQILKRFTTTECQKLEVDLLLGCSKICGLKINLDSLNLNCT